LRRVDAFDVLILDDIGYIERDYDELEALLALLAEWYERRGVVITSNLVFSQWDRIFSDPMTTAAAVDRMVRHAVIVDMTGKGKRAEDALARNDFAVDAATVGAQRAPRVAGGTGGSGNSDCRREGKQLTLATPPCALGPRPTGRTARFHSPLTKTSHPILIKAGHDSAPDRADIHAASPAMCNTPSCCSPQGTRWCRYGRPQWRQDENAARSAASCSGRTGA